MQTRWLNTDTFSYQPDENGHWRGHWIGRVWGPGERQARNIRGVSFASRRRGRIWAVWIGRPWTTGPGRNVNNVTSRSGSGDATKPPQKKEATL